MQVDNSTVRQASMLVKENIPESNSSNRVSAMRKLFGDTGSKNVVGVKKDVFGPATEEAVKTLRMKVKKALKENLLRFSSYNLDNLIELNELMFVLGNEIGNYPNTTAAVADVNRYIKKFTA